MRSKGWSGCSCPARTSRTDQPSNGAKASSHSWTAAANAGLCSSSSAPMSRHWLPCPGKTQVVRPRSQAVAVVAPSVRSPVAIERRPATASPRSVQRTLARCRSSARRVASTSATSSSEVSGCASSQSASCDAIRERAVGVAAESSIGSRGPMVAGACSWARARGRLLQDEVGVGAADAEGGDAGPARAGSARPGACPAQQLQAGARPVDEGAGRVGVQGARQGLVLQREHHLDHAEHTGRRLRVPDVGLERAEGHRRRAVGVAGEDLRRARPPRSGRRGACRCRGRRSRRCRPGRRRRRPSPPG